MGEPHAARAWGVEHLSPEDRVLKALDAGADQFGGESDPDLVIDLVRAGLLSEERVDESVARILREKFRLGLFDEARYVDPDRAEEIVGNAGFVREGRAAQTRSLAVLTDSGSGGRTALPLVRPVKVMLRGIALPADTVGVQAVTEIADADVAVLRIDAPFDPRPGRFESFFRAGRLDFDAGELADLLGIVDTVPTIVVIHLDRPAVIPEVADRAAAVIADFGAGDEAIWDVLLGRRAAEGRLPFDLPRSMAAVVASRSDMPFDTDRPLFSFGHGLQLRR